MPWLDIIWEHADPNGNVAHIAEHGVTTEEVEQVLQNPEFEGASASTGRPFVEGFTAARRYILVVFERIDDVTVYPSPPTKWSHNHADSPIQSKAVTSRDQTSQGAGCEDRPGREA